MARRSIALTASILASQDTCSKTFKALEELPSNNFVRKSLFIDKVSGFGKLGKLVKPFI
jgi:hypothetical protein